MGWGRGLLECNSNIRNLGVKRFNTGEERLQEASVEDCTYGNSRFDSTKYDIQGRGGVYGSRRKGLGVCVSIFHFILGLFGNQPSTRHQHLRRVYLSVSDHLFIIQQARSIRSNLWILLNYYSCHSRKLVAYVSHLLFILVIT